MLHYLKKLKATVALNFLFAKLNKTYETKQAEYSVGSRLLRFTKERNV